MHDVLHFAYVLCVCVMHLRVMTSGKLHCSAYCLARMCNASKMLARSTSN